MKSRYRITEKDGIYFITSTSILWVPIFTSKIYFDILIKSFKFCQDNMNLKIYAYIILDNHFHAVVSHPDLSKVIQSLKSYTAKAIIQQLKKDNKQWLLDIFYYQKKRYKDESTFQVWQEGAHPQLIMNHEMLNQKIEYTHYNIVKRGVVLEPDHWFYSSAANYAEKKEVALEIEPYPV